MPPKKKAVESRAEPSLGEAMELVVATEGDAADLESHSRSPDPSTFSMDSSASTRSSGSLSAEQLEKILEANTRSMMALIAASRGSGPVAPVESPRPAVARVDIPKWVEGESPSDFFGKYEQALSHNGVDRSKWGSLLQVYISGSAQASFRQLNPAVLSDYDQVKKEMLESLGDTPDGADKRWFSLARQRGENHRALFRRVHNTGFRRMDGLETKEACCNKMVLSKFLTLLSPECYACVSAKRPSSGMEAAKYAQEFEEDASFARSLQPRNSGGHYHYKREQGGGSFTGNTSSGAQSKDSIAGQNSSVGAAQSNGGKQVRNDKPARKPIVCHGCGEAGHIRPNCPHKVRRVKSPEPGNVMFVKGWLAGRKVGKLRIDTGADRTVVRADFVPLEAYTDKVVKLDSWRGAQCSEHKVARITIKVGEVEDSANVAVVDQLDCPALLGRDLGPKMIAKLMSIVMKRVEAKPDDSENSRATMQADAVRTTRAQAAKAKAEAEEDELVSDLSECSPVTWEELDVAMVESLDEDSVPTPLSCEGPADVEVAEIPLPKLVDSDKDSLCQEQQADPTLKVLCLLAGKREKGYSFMNDILVHTTSDELGDDVVRILVPKGRRLKVLEVAHTHMMAGHFGRKKTFARLQNKFLWPRMWVEVKEYVRTCAACQRASRKDKARAPLQPLQCEDEPFSKVAFDLVGPLPKSKSGFRYVLTMMDLFTKYPAAVPLKRVDNTTVIEAMMDVFSCYGLPKMLLTDQGSVFTSKLTRAMCEQFGIEKIQTSPYHPQSDGALERWHACLKSMLKKKGELQEWDRHLKYLLFAYRSTPHCTTGFSPFTLLYGREVRGPLDILQESWLQKDCENASVFLSGSLLLRLRWLTCLS